MITHIAADRMIVYDIFGPNKTRTTKTLCEKRVSYTHIVRDNPTCPICKEWIETEEKLAKELEIEL